MYQEILDHCLTFTIDRNLDKRYIMVTVQHIIPSNNLVERKACSTDPDFFGEQGCSPVRKELYI